MEDKLKHAYGKGQDQGGIDYYHVMQKLMFFCKVVGTGKMLQVGLLGEINSNQIVRRGKAR